MHLCFGVLHLYLPGMKQSPLRVKMAPFFSDQRVEVSERQSARLHLQVCASPAVPLLTKAQHYSNPQTRWWVTLRNCIGMFVTSALILLIVTWKHTEIHVEIMYCVTCHLVQLLWRLAAINVLEESSHFSHLYSLFWYFPLLHWSKWQNCEPSRPQGLRSLSQKSAASEKDAVQLWIYNHSCCWLNLGYNRY